MSERAAENVRDLIKVDIEENGIGTITFNRARAMNAMTRAMVEEFARVVKSLEKNDTVKVIILTGAGRGFSAGMDLVTAQELFQGDVRNSELDPVYQLELCKKPIIGAVNGFAITGGFEIALACDILISSTNAQFVDTHAKFGLHPSWGLSQKLSRMIGINRARHISLTCMPVNAELAYEWGLVSKVVPPTELMKAARDIAEQVLKNNQKMVQQYKLVLNSGYNLSFSDGRKLERENAFASYAAMTDQDFAEIASFLAGRPSNAPKTSSKL